MLPRSVLSLSSSVRPLEGRTDADDRGSDFRPGCRECKVRRLPGVAGARLGVVHLRRSNPGDGRPIERHIVAWAEADLYQLRRPDPRRPLNGRAQRVNETQTEPQPLARLGPLRSRGSCASAAGSGAPGRFLAGFRATTETKEWPRDRCAARPKLNGFASPQDSVAEDAGFELARGCPQHAFQHC